MPNWAFGTVDVTGTEQGVISFAERFIDYKESVTAGKRFFARSFLDEHRTELIKSIRAQHDGKPEDEEMTARFDASFAWSAYSCIIDGYPQHNPKELITITEACIEDAVSVEIRTEEPGMAFEEEIICDPSGELSYDSKDMRAATCRACGNIQSVGSHADLDEVECCECGECGFDYTTKEE